MYFASLLENAGTSLLTVGIHENTNRYKPYPVLDDTMFSLLTFAFVVTVLFMKNVSCIRRQELLQSLLNTSRYDPSVPPDFDKDDATVVTVQVSVRNMYSVSETHMEYSLDCLLRQWWRDERMSYDNRDDINATKLELDTRLLGSIWQPDLYFKNEKRGSVHGITNTNKLLHIYRNGTILYSMRVALTLTCTMLLQFFPFDTQTCTMEISSFGYTDENIDINWKKASPVEISHLELAQFRLSQDVTTQEYSETYETGTYSTLKAALLIDRKTGYYALQVIIPSILLVILSWVSFWVDPKAVPARVSLGVTCVLTMTTQSSGIRQTLPPVSYVKAIDVWMMVCLLFVFAALLEFAFVNVSIRRTDAYKPDKTVTDCENPETVAGKENKLKNMFKICMPRNADPEGANSTTRIDYAARAAKADHISRIAFPAVFILFMIVFYCVCLLSPDPVVSK